jgi:branched-subunit amino acid transport protein
MAVEGTAGVRRDRPTTGTRHPGIVRAMQVVLRLLAVAVFAQAVFAGLFLDGGGAWRGWHAINGMLLLPLLALVQVVLAVLVWRRGRGSGWLAIASVGLLLALLVQNVLGQTGQVAVHIPLGVAIFGLVGTLLVGARTLTRPVTHPTAAAVPPAAPIRRPRHGRQ